MPAVVVTAPKSRRRARCGSARYHADLAREGFAWTRRTSAADLFKPGDLIDVAIVEAGRGDRRGRRCTLEQTPLVEGALVAIDNRTGQIRAMVGGWSFARSKFNRAVQAYRQLGSTFKPIVYTAAIDRGFTPTSILVDEPVSYAGRQRPDLQPAQLRPQVRGPDHAAPRARGLAQHPGGQDDGHARAEERARLREAVRFEEDFPPYLSIALGAGDATLLEITSAYTAFPNQGVRMKPFDVLNVTDRDGNLLEENRAEPNDVDPRRHGVRDDEPAARRRAARHRRARGQLALDWPLAGKTGTVDDNTDAWFVGFDPDITVGVWVGLRREEVARRQRDRARSRRCRSGWSS